MRTSAREYWSNPANFEHAIPMSVYPWVSTDTRNNSVMTWRIRPSIAAPTWRVIKGNG
jgi:hypothetical protein